MKFFRRHKADRKPQVSKQRTLAPESLEQRRLMANALYFDTKSSEPYALASGCRAVKRSGCAPEASANGSQTSTFGVKVEGIGLMAADAFNFESLDDPTVVAIKTEMHQTVDELAAMVQQNTNPEQFQMALEVGDPQLLLAK